ncbi:hypothetical protein MSAN_01701400 [Mycena sanguinolenta]|uniref:Uncharacterized protein n=1 Tax=Mycena sanguinolenta TaxID=230812 RepID=A0A8H6Y0W4_9AGAR|nr:hypothetical protein MSAN_01701400 [Mycena sanguinolenta]
MDSSQIGTRYNLAPCSDDSQMPSSDSYLDSSQTAAEPDHSALLVDHLANNYGLDNESRAELHLTRSLPCVQSKVALIQHACVLQNQQAVERLMAMCGTIQDSAEINAACKAVFFTGRLTDFDNEILKPQVVTHLKKYKDTNGFKLFFEESSQAHTRVIFGQVGRALSGTKSFFRKSVLQSLPDEKGGGGCSVTELANTLGRKCLGGIENVKAKHVIWLLIVRSLVLADKELRTAVADIDDDGDSDDNGESSSTLLPAKRTHGGTVKGRSSNGKIIAAYWNRMQLLWKHKNKKFGTADLKSEAWTAYVNTCVAQERVRFPYDALTLITGNAAVAAPAQSSVTVNRLAALPLLNEAGGSRPPLTPRPSNAAPSFTTRSSLDQIMNTPTPFTFNGVPLPAAYSLPPLNTRRREDVGGARYNSGH